MRSGSLILRNPSCRGNRKRHAHPWRWCDQLKSITDQEKIDTRRHCGYPVYGGSPSGFSSWRFFQVFGLLEYRMNNLAQGELIILRRYLLTLESLESGIPLAAQNLDTNQAAVWSRNPREVTERNHLYNSWCHRLCKFLGLPPGPGLAGGGRSLIV